MRLQFNFVKKKKKLGFLNIRTLNPLRIVFPYTFRVTTIFKGIFRIISLKKIILLIFIYRIVETCTFVYTKLTFVNLI